MNMFIFTVILVLAGAVSRLVPHPPNVAAVAAISLVGGLYLDKRVALAVPLGAMVLSDVLIGFHGLTLYVYGGFVLTGLIGIGLRKFSRPGALAIGSVTASLLFFIVTNAGVWLNGDGTTYPKTVEGLILCYTAAIPFLRNSLVGDLLYTGLLAAIFELAIRHGFKTSLPHQASL